MKKFWKPSLITASIVMTFVFSSVALSEQPDETSVIQHQEVNQESLAVEAKKFREIYGLDSSDKYVMDTLLNRELQTDYEKLLGFPLTDEELSIIGERDKAMDASQNIRDTMELKYNDIFGGIYFDATNGVTTVYITDIDRKEEIKSELIHQYPNNEIVVENAGITIDELYDIAKNIRENKPVNYTGIMVNEIDRKIIIFHKNDDDELELKSLLSGFVDSKYVEFEKIEKVSALLKLGEKIDSPQRTPCSTGFYGKRNNIDVLITAGHCNKLGLSADWEDENGNYIGSFGSKTSGSIVYTDVSSINLSSNVNKVSAVGNYYVTSVNLSSDVAGSLRIKTGFKTGTTSGEVVGPACFQSEDFENPDPDVDEVCGMVVKNMTAQRGDSGGIVYRIPTHAELYGTVATGIYGDNGDDYAMYSRISDTIADFSISAIYGDHDGRVIWGNSSVTSE